MTTWIILTIAINVYGKISHMYPVSERKSTENWQYFKKEARKWHLEFLSRIWMENIMNDKHNAPLLVCMITVKRVIYTLGITNTSLRFNSKVCLNEENKIHSGKEIIWKQDNHMRHEYQWDRFKKGIWWLLRDTFVYFSIKTNVVGSDESLSLNYHQLPFLSVPLNFIGSVQETYVFLHYWI